MAESESALLGWLKPRLKTSPALLLGPGDDAAVVRLADRRAVLHVDQCVEDVHFRRGTPWKTAGAKAVLRCASDLAAMGCRPVAALAAAALPSRLSTQNRRDLVLGMEAAARSCGIRIVGGDLSATTGPVVLGITVLGEVPKGMKPITRAGARPGDLLAVTGRLGGAVRSGRHLRPVPRIREALILQRRLDLSRLLDESRAGAVVVGSWIPVHPDARSLGQALSEGEDYELLFAFPRAQAKRLRGLGFKVTVIGQVTTPSRGRRLLLPDGTLADLPRKGWEHRL